MSVVPQLINIGSAPNDGTGDRPRPMAIKYNNTVTALAAAINAGITGVAISSGHLVITKADGSTTDIGIITGTVNGGTTAVPGSTLIQLPALTAAANILLAGSDTAGNLGGLTLTALLAWLVAQSPDLAAAPHVDALLSGDLLPLIRGGSIVLIPATTATFPTSTGSGGGTGGSGSTGGSGTTPTVGVTFGVAASPSSVVVGSAIMFTITPGSGGWPSNEVVTPSVSGVAGTFDQATKVGVGTNAVTFVFTPSGAGTATLSASANGMNLSGSPAMVTVNAQSSTPTQPALVLSNATFADRGDGSGLKMLTGGSASVPITLPSDGNCFVKIGVKGGTDYSYNDSTLFLAIMNANGSVIGARWRNRALITVAPGSGVPDPAPATITDGGQHTVIYEARSGGSSSSAHYWPYIDGSITGGDTITDVGVSLAAGACTLTIAGGTLPAIEAGLYDVRIYAGSVAAPGAKLYEWQLNGNGS